MLHVSDRAHWLLIARALSRGDNIGVCARAPLYSRGACPSPRPDTSSRSMDGVD